MLLVFFSAATTPLLRLSFCPRQSACASRNQYRVCRHAPCPSAPLLQPLSDQTAVRSANAGVGSSSVAIKSIPAALLSTTCATDLCTASPRMAHHLCCSDKAMPLRTLTCSPLVRSRASLGTKSTHCRLHLPYTSLPRQSSSPRPLRMTSP